MEVSTKGYYLPKDVQEWIRRQADKENRSASNYLSTLIRHMMQEEADRAAG